MSGMSPEAASTLNFALKSLLGNIVTFNLTLACFSISLVAALSSFQTRPPSGCVSEIVAGAAGADEAAGALVLSPAVAGLLVSSLPHAAVNAVAIETVAKDAITRFVDLVFIDFVSPL
ncbi:hypothetical protein D3C85_1285650 [compost metagenome]